jgi:hypothetical protein
MSGTVSSARCPVEEQVLSDVDLLGVIISMLFDAEWEDEDDGEDEDKLEDELATHAAHSLCLTSASIRAAVLAS